MTLDTRKRKFSWGCFFSLVRFDTSLYACDSTNYQIISDKNVQMMDGNTSSEPTIFNTMPYFVFTSDLLASSHTILLSGSPTKKKCSTYHKEYICCELVYCYCLCSLNFCVEKQSTRRLIFCSLLFYCIRKERSYELITKYFEQNEMRWKFRSHQIYKQSKCLNIV